MRTLLSGRSCVVLAALCAAGGSAATAQRAAAPARSPQSVVDELLAADREFSRVSAGPDVVSGLVAMFASDVTVMLPTGRFAENATQAAEALRSNTANEQSRAQWTPIRGGVSADGQHGFTFGYMTVTGADGAVTPLKYLAYWVRKSEGWRVVAYKRGGRANGDVSQALMAPALPALVVPANTDSAAVERHRSSLDQAERAFSDRAQKIGLGAAFAQFGSADAVNMGGANSTGFVLGAEAIGRTIGAGGPTDSSPVSWAPDRVIIASSGDLGITIGMIRSNQAAANGERIAIPFFTIWRRVTLNDPWRYIAE